MNAHPHMREQANRKLNILQKMCRRNVSKRNFLCGHVLETLGSLVPEKGCGGCGIEKVEKGENNDIGSSHVHSPCDDCLAKDLWAQGKNGKWYEKEPGGPFQLSPGYKFPCKLDSMKCFQDHI